MVELHKCYVEKLLTESRFQHYLACKESETVVIYSEIRYTYLEMPRELVTQNQHTK